MFELRLSTGSVTVARVAQTVLGRAHRGRGGGCRSAPAGQALRLSRCAQVDTLRELRHLLRTSSLGLYVRSSLVEGVRSVCGDMSIRGRLNRQYRHFLGAAVDILDPAVWLRPERRSHDERQPGCRYDSCMHGRWPCRPRTCWFRGLFNRGSFALARTTSSVEYLASVALRCHPRGAAFGLWALCRLPLQMLLPLAGRP